MKKQEEKSLDKLFEGLNELQQEQPSAAFLEDLELRLDALEKKKRKPLFAWWVWSVLGAVVIVAGLIGYSNKSSFGASNASNRNSSPYQTATKSSALKQTTAPTSAKSSTSSFNLTSSTVTPPRDQSFSSSSAISSSSTSTSLSSSTPIKNRDESLTQASTEVQSNNDLTASNSSLTSNAEKEIKNQQPTENTKPAEITILDASPSEISSAPIDLKVNKEIPLDQLHPKQGQAKHSVGLQFGVSGIFSSFEVPESTAALAGYDPHLYRNFRSVSERQTSSWDFNLRYQFFFGRFGIQTGLSYLEWGEQYKYDVISVDGTNRYQYVQVPLCLAYQFPMKKLIFQPSVGVGIGYGLKTAGAYIQPSLNQVQLVSASTWSKNSQLQLEFIYSISDNIMVSIAPVYRRTFGNLIDNGVIMNRYQSVGLLTGLSFKF
jgi:cytoskeletal protein RodZ